MNIKISNITKKYASTDVLKNISCDIFDGEFVSFLGPSGSGKSTFLNILAGIVKPTEGEIYFDGEKVNTFLPKERNVGFVFQNYALYPNMTAYKNIEFPLDAIGIKVKERKRIINDIADLVKISHLLNKRPHELSGGEQQRVALARALVKKPKLLLLDEPFSNLDPRLSADMREEIKKIQEQLKITTIMVTHNQTEAMEMSDRIALLHSGELIQFDSARDLYLNPQNLFCAQFLGDPKINTIEGYIKKEIFYSLTGELKLKIENTIDGDAILCCRPESIRISNTYSELSGKVISIYNRGREYVINVDICGVIIKMIIPVLSEVIPNIDDIISIDIEKIFLYDKKTGERRLE